MKTIKVIGGGLAGSEAAWQIANTGIQVELFEMRPHLQTGAHQTDNLAELICSNSLGSKLFDRASGVLKNELNQLGSLLLRIAEETSLPAGSALAVDRKLFSEMVTQEILNHPNIHVIRREFTSIPDEMAIISTGPLTSSTFSNSISQFCGQANLYFFDAISPIILKDSINMNIAYRLSRRAEESETDGDYINCPFHDKKDYLNFVNALKSAERITLKYFEEEILNGVNAGPDLFFEGCLPVEIIAERGEKSLAFGPLRPVGLKDPLFERQPYAVVQLRQDNLAGNLFNMVGFQTNLTFPEQKRIFRMIPGLEDAEFARFGQMHRNTFIASPKLLLPTLQSANRPDLFFAGQLTGVEGYLGNIGTGLVAGLNASRIMNGREPLVLPKETMLGSLVNYITHVELKHFQPMKANFGILPALDNLDQKSTKKERALQYSIRSKKYIDSFMKNT